MAAFYDAAESFFCHYVSIFRMADYLLSLRRPEISQRQTYADRNDNLLDYSIDIWKDNL
jgi:hypothetical protein